MKHTNIHNIFLLIALGATLAACNSASSYSTQLAQEKRLIANYLKVHNINVVYTLPADDAWGENDYYQVPGYDNLYYRLVHRGDSLLIQGDDTTRIEPVMRSELVVMRYRQYTLTEYPDTISYWTTMDNAYPAEFRFQTDYTNASNAWHLAVELMQYSNSECKIICPSKQGLSAEQNSVTPYGYDLHMKIKR